MSHFKNNKVNNVAIIGVTGRVGGAFTEELLKAGKTVTALTRKSSSKIPKEVKVAEVDYDNEQSVVDALKGQDVLIITLSVAAPRDQQSKIVAAAAKAGVPYIFHNHYGGDITKENVNNDTMIGEGERAIRKQIEDLGVSKWIAFSNGFWYEWSLPIVDAYGFDIKNKAVTFYDDGETVFDTSTWPQCGRAMAALLSLPVTGEGLTLDSFANKPFYINSYRVTQKDILKSLLRVTGDKESDWKITYEPAMERFKDGQAKVFGGDRSAFAKLLYGRALAKDGSVFFGDKLSNKALNLPQEDMDESTKFAVQFVADGRDWYKE